MTALNRKRILLYSFDGGTGVGHLRRISTLARSLQKEFACMIITGNRDVSNWFIPEESEFVRLPSWDTLLSSRSAYWKKQPFLDLSLDEAVSLRKRIITGVIEAYMPDLMIVEHLPLGAHNELADILPWVQCPMYLVTRGVLNVSGNLCDLVFGEQARQALEKYYDRIVVACDSQVMDFASTYEIPPILAEKTVHVGYITDGIPKAFIQKTRAKRGVKPAQTWIVVSAGGGQLGEELIETSIIYAREHPDHLFDIVVGPRSKLTHIQPPGSNTYVHTETRDMALLNASADVVVCSGGYNSLLESLQGNARVICVPNWKDPKDEQTRHPLLLSRFADVQLASSVSALLRTLDEAIKEAAAGPPRDQRASLDCNGGSNTRRLVELDLLIHRAVHEADAPLISHNR